MMATAALRLRDAALAWVATRRHPVWQTAHGMAMRLQTRLAGSAFSRNVTVMLAGTVLGQAMSVLLAPALTRLYSPEQFGALGVYMSTLNILAVAAALRYEIPMSTARSATELVNLLAVSGVALVLTTSAFATLAALMPRSALAAAGVVSLDGDRLLLPMGFACLGAYYIMLYYATWAHEFEAISRTRMSQGLSGPLSQIVMGVLGMGVGGLAAGFVIGQSSGTLLLFHRVVIRGSAPLTDISWRKMLEVARRYRAFPLISTWASVIDSAGAGQLVYILVAVLYPGPIAGYMFLAERVVARPLQMVSTSMLTVYMAEIGKTMHDDPARLKRRFLQVTSRQLCLGAAWVLAADMITTIAFQLIFGAAWAAAVPYLLLLSLAYLANSVIGSVVHTLPVLRRQSLAAAWQVGRVAAICLGFAAAVHAHLSAMCAVGIYAAIQIAACCLLYLLMKASIERLPSAATGVAA